MYVPTPFAEDEVATLHALIRAHPLATLVTMTDDGLEANHIPLIVDPEPEPYGRLRGHAPRANPLTRGEHRRLDALAIFHGPEGYITPSWYATKRETGKVVPTWNYAVVHAYGRLELIDDPAWVRDQVETLTDRQEAAFDQPWKVADAPREFSERMIASLVGLEIVVTRLVGKTKASQNQPAANRAGVVAGLDARGEPEATALAELTRRHDAADDDRDA